jgi:hypothetical protein
MEVAIGRRRLSPKPSIFANFLAVRYGRAQKAVL